ncbi:hypothetical protein PINS_up009231 [Pythium insidiosum]|nr:hypothetical protein PINS_up009231 [Pythium insidiosum]
MSSSYKQKKLRTLATRKKTRKRKMQLGLSHEDESGRLFQPPSRRDPRWKKPSADDLVNGVVRARKKQRVSILSGSEDDDEDDEEEQYPEQEAEAHDSAASDEDDGDEDIPQDLTKPVITLCKSIDDLVSRAASVHKEIRRADGRQKAKVLVLTDSQSVLKALKKALNVKAEPVKSKSKFGVRSEKKAVMAFRNIAPLKTPMDRFKDANEDVLKDFKCGKVPTLLAEDLSYYPYSDLGLQHVVFLAKSAQAAINLDRALLSTLQLHMFALDEAPSSSSSSSSSSISADDRARLQELFIVQ